MPAAYELNQRPAAEVARPLLGAILIPPALLVVADFFISKPDGFANDKGGEKK